MTRKESLDKIKELEEYIKNLDGEICYKDDKLFLLSINEYNMFSRFIPKCYKRWWLRSYAYGYTDRTMVVDIGSIERQGFPFDHDYFNDDRFFDYNNHICDCSIGIRPALRLDTSDNKIGSSIIYKGIEFTVIDNNIAISNEPITFNKFNYKGNGYNKSFVRKLLLRLDNEAETINDHIIDTIVKDLDKEYNEKLKGE